MKERSQVLLLQPMKSDVMLYRKAVQAAGWSLVTQMPLVLWSMPRRKNLNVRAVKRITLYFLPSDNKYRLSNILVEARWTFPVLRPSFVQPI